MAMEKTGITEQDIADHLMGKDEDKQANAQPRKVPVMIGEDEASKLASHAKKAIAKNGKAV